MSEWDGAYRFGSHELPLGSRRQLSFAALRAMHAHLGSLVAAVESASDAAQDEFDRFMEINTRAGNVLRNNGLTAALRVWELSDEEILRLPMCGKETLRAIRGAFPFPLVPNADPR